MALLFASCNKKKTTNELTLSPDESLVTLTFSPYSMEPIRDDIGTVVNRLDVWIVDGEDVYDYHQVKDQTTTFGTLYVALNRTKTYTLYAVGHKAAGEATLTDNIISFPDDKVTHSMFFTTTFTPASSTSLSCAMQRIVGMFKCVVTDAIPAAVDHMRFAISESGTRFNVVTQTATNKVERESIPSSMTPNQQTGYTTFNIFVMSDDMTSTIDVDITAQAIDEDGNVVEEHQFNDVPIKNGWSTTYTGTFFVTTGFTINFTIGDWSNFDDHPY